MREDLPATRLDAKDWANLIKDYEFKIAPDGYERLEKELEAHRQPGFKYGDDVAKDGQEYISDEEAEKIKNAKLDRFFGLNGCDEEDILVIESPTYKELAYVFGQLYKLAGEFKSKNFLFVCLFAGHGFTHDGHYCFMTNEFDKRSNFYKLFEV